MNEVRKNKLLVGLITIIVSIGLFSCNSEFDRVITEKNGLDTATAKFGNRKVLYLIVDGARGESVLTSNKPNIDAILPSSIVSWVGLSDPDQTADVSNWANMLTGVKKNKHGVLDDALTNNNLQNYPAFFQRIKEFKPSTRMLAFTPSTVFKSLIPAATVSNVVAGDEQVKAEVVNALTTDTASLVVGHFMDVDKAGTQYGYDNSFPEYKAAIEKFDGYVGEIMAALKKRPTYNNEDWLVVIASNGGGNYTLPPNTDDQTVFSKPVANTFVIYHNTRYKRRVISKPFTGNRYLGKTVRLFGQNMRAQVDTASIFNINDTTVATIELKVKKVVASQSWPSILGKRAEWSSGHPGVGWVVFLENNYWYFAWRGTKDSGGKQCRGGDISVNKWENISIKIEKRGAQRFVRTYTNGVYNNELELSNDGSLLGNTLENNFPLKLGYMNGNGNGEANVYISDIRFFQAEVPDAVIGNYACQTSIDQSHPLYGFLAGYWPGTDGNGNKIIDLGPQARDFKFINTPTWENFNDIICPPSAAALSVFVPQTIDIPSQIINWFKIANKQTWALDGRVWLDQ